MGGVFEICMHMKGELVNELVKSWHRQCSQNHRTKERKRKEVKDSIIKV